MSEIVRVEHKITEAVKAEVSQLTPDNPALAGWSAFSKSDLDGIIHECLERISSKARMTKSCIELGCGDGSSASTHLLILNGYRGIWTDEDRVKVEGLAEELGGFMFPNLSLCCLSLSSASIDEYFEDWIHKLHGSTLDFISFGHVESDINYVPLIAKKFQPYLIALQYNPIFRPPMRNARVQNSEAPEAADYFGASLQTWVDNLSDYLLVCCDLGGSTAFFVRRTFASAFTEYPVIDLYQPQRINFEKQDKKSLSWLRQLCNPGNFQLGLPISVCLPQIGRLQLNVHSSYDRYISTALKENGRWEPFETEIFSKLCRPGLVVVDAGANIGWYSIIALRLLHRNGEVIAIEPNAKNFHLLEQNLLLNDHDQISETLNCALGASDGVAQLFHSDINLGDHRVFSGNENRSKSTVPLTSLDEIFSTRVRLPDLIKSDTQGSEMQIIKGSQKLFQQGCRPLLILEFWPDRKSVV